MLTPFLQTVSVIHGGAYDVIEMGGGKNSPINWVSEW